VPTVKCPVGAGSSMVWTGEAGGSGSVAPPAQSPAIAKAMPPIVLIALLFMSQLPLR